MEIWQTDRPTDHATRLYNNRPHLSSTMMRRIEVVIRCVCVSSAGRLRRACLDVGASSFATTRTSVVISSVLCRPTSSTATSRHPHPPSKHTISSCVRAYRSTSVSPLVVACLHYAPRIIGAFFVTKRLRLWLPSGWPISLYVAVYVDDAYASGLSTTGIC